MRTFRCASRFIGFIQGIAKAIPFRLARDLARELIPIYCVVTCKMAAGSKRTGESMKALKIATTTEDPELAARFDRVLGQTVEALEESGLRYAFIGGIASGGLGRPRSTHDIDVFVRPEEAELALRALAKKGFRTEKTDPNWLYKGFKENILVDVIFKSKGEIYLDTEMYQRMITAEFHGKQLRLVAPEDLIIIKAAAHSELTPGHWHDALALLSHATLDWDYLIRRARRAPRRILSLMLYAQSADIWVPNRVVNELYRVLFGEAPVSRDQILEEKLPVPPRLPLRPAQHSRSMALGHALEAYAAAHLREILAEDSRINELEVLIEQGDGKLLLRGEVATSERRDLICQIGREKFPNLIIESQIRVLNLDESSEEEVLK